MKPLKLVTCALLAGILLEAQMNVPVLGAAHFGDGSLHIVRGVGANFIVERQALGYADAASFSDAGGLVASRGIIRLVRTNGTPIGEYRSSEPRPILHIDATLESAAAWLPSEHLLLRWDGAKFVPALVDDAAFGGTIGFIRLTSASAAQFWAARSDGSVARISVSLASGRVTSSDTEPAGRGSAMIVEQGWTVSQDEWGLVAEQANGSRQTVKLSEQVLPAGDITFEQMSNHWLHVWSTSKQTSWAVYVDPARFAVFLLPPPPARAVKERPR